MSHKCNLLSMMFFSLNLMHVRFILGSPFYQYFIVFLVKPPHLHFVNCISISICCKRTSEISSFNVSSKFNMFNITTRSCPKTSLVYFGCLKLTLYQRAQEELMGDNIISVLFGS